MKSILLVFLLLIIHFSLFAQQDSGFTDKMEAANKLVNGLKEGKWLEYLDDTNAVTTNTDAPYYCLTIYKAGKPQGIVRVYYDDCKLRGEIPYTNGKENGIKKEYYKNGRLEHIVPYTDGVEVGLEKWYYNGGQLEEAITFKQNGEQDSVKRYDKKGREIASFPNHFTMVPFINTLWQSSLYLQVDLGHIFDISFNDDYPWRSIDALTKLGAEFYLYSKKLLWAPEYSWELNVSLCSLKGTLEYFMQSGQGKFYFTPEIGITVYGAITFGCGYNIHLAPTRFNEVKPFQISATCVIPYEINPQIDNDGDLQ
ncbi:MAG TPA: hypothetical protein VNZ45_07380 [Bacteroidia bacterium]|jgi:hypothetical protein|nr:hypothetical protein [Bacteroidia bacterium]